MGVRGKGSGVSIQRPAIDPRSSILDLRPSSLPPQSSFCVRIADITIAVASNDAGLTLWAEGATKTFVVDEANPDVKVRVAWADFSNETIEPVREILEHAPDNSPPSRSLQRILPLSQEAVSQLADCPSTGSGRTAKYLNFRMLHPVRGDPSTSSGLKAQLREPVLSESRRIEPWTGLRHSLEGERGKIFDSGALWQLYHLDSAYHFRFSSPACGPLPYKVASFNPSFTSGEVFLNRCYFNPAQPVYPLEYPLDELMIINLLATGRGVEVHACGLIDPSGNGHLFVGQSGAGKTTMARLWQPEDGVTILSDDRIILRRDGNRLWMYGTPWHGEAGFSCSARAPLKQIFVLLHGQENELVPIGGATAAARLFACSFPPFYSPAGLDFNLGFFAEVVRTIPCYELSFVPDERVVEFVLGRR